MGKIMAMNAESRKEGCSFSMSLVYVASSLFLALLRLFHALLASAATQLTHPADEYAIAILRAEIAAASYYQRCLIFS